MPHHHGMSNDCESWEMFCLNDYAGMCFPINPECLSDPSVTCCGHLNHPQWYQDYPGGNPLGDTVPGWFEPKCFHGSDNPCDDIYTSRGACLDPARFSPHYDNPNDLQQLYCPNCLWISEEACDRLNSGKGGIWHGVGTDCYSLDIGCETPFDEDCPKPVPTYVPHHPGGDSGCFNNCVAAVDIIRDTMYETCGQRYTGSERTKKDCEERCDCLASADRLRCGGIRDCLSLWEERQGTPLEHQLPHGTVPQAWFNSCMWWANYDKGKCHEKCEFNRPGGGIGEERRGEERGRDWEKYVHRKQRGDVDPLGHFNKSTRRRTTTGNHQSYLGRTVRKTPAKSRSSTRSVHSACDNYPGTCWDLGFGYKFARRINGGPWVDSPDSWWTTPRLNLDRENVIEYAQKSVMCPKFPPGTTPPNWRRGFMEIYLNGWDFNSSYSRVEYNGRRIELPPGAGEFSFEANQLVLQVPRPNPAHETVHTIKVVTQPGFSPTQLPLLSFRVQHRVPLEDELCTGFPGEDCKFAVTNWFKDQGSFQECYYDYRSIIDLGGTGED